MLTHTTTAEDRSVDVARYHSGLISELVTTIERFDKLLSERFDELDTLSAENDKLKERIRELEQKSTE